MLLQLRAQNRKNWILSKRSLCCTLAQIIIPIVFALFLVVVRLLAPIEYYNQQDYLSNKTYTLTHYGDPALAKTKLNITQPVVLKQCDADQIVALVPEGDPMVLKLKAVLQIQGYNVSVFRNDNKVDEIIRDTRYSFEIPEFCFGVTIANDGNSYKYSLRYNTSHNEYQTDSPSTFQSLTTARSLNQVLYYRTVKSGFISIATIINTLILQQNTNTSAMLQNTQGLIYQQPFFVDEIYDNLGSTAQLLLLLPLLVIYLRQTSMMLYEKQNHIREALLITGMKLKYYYLGWFLQKFIIYTLVNLAVSGIVSGVLKYVPYYVPFIMFMMFHILLIVQSFFVQTFVTSARIGVIAGLILFIIQYFVYYLIISNQTPTFEINRYISIVAFSSLILSFKYWIFSESIQTTATLSGFVNEYTLKTALLSIGVNMVVFGVLAWYLGQVFPNAYGLRKHPLFFLKCFSSESMAQKRRRDELSNQVADINSLSANVIRPEQGESSNFQQIELTAVAKYQNRHQTITLRNIYKKYGDKQVVQNLNLTLYPSQIFVLLGHNGAGKTTTISILTGTVEPNRGVVEILGETRFSQIRQKIGICMQRQRLYEQLTVEEHLMLYGRIRGIRKEDLVAEIDKLIKDVDLDEKRNSFAGSLSGGQKRKLSIALAFVGGSKVIILDEPTSGMDTSSRRLIWKLLKQYKKDRVILLTTHYMDEADYIGQRIGVIQSGKLVALGSSVFLKNKYGTGYRITFAKSSAKVKNQPIIKLIRKYVPQSSIVSDASTELSMQLPFKKINLFPSIFEALDKKKKRLGIEAYGISITNLEEVFLRIAEGASAMPNEPNQQIIQSTYAMVEKVHIDRAESDKVEVHKITVWDVEGQKAETQKVEGDKAEGKKAQGVLAEGEKVQVPASVNFLTIPQSNLRRQRKYSPGPSNNLLQVPISGDKREKKFSNSEQASEYGEPSSEQNSQIEGLQITREDSNTFCRHFQATLLKRLRIIKRDIKTFMFEFFLPIFFITLGLLFARVNFDKDFPELQLSYKTYYGELNSTVSLPIAASSANTALLAGLAAKISTSIGSLIDLKQYTYNSAVEFDKGTLYGLKTSQSSFKGGIYFQPLQTTNTVTLVPFTSIVNSRSPTSFVTVQTVAAEAYINSLLTGKTITITAVNKPFVQPIRQYMLKSAYGGFFLGIIFTISFAFKYASVASFIVKQRQSKCKNQQLISGMNINAYWCANYVYDVIQYIFLAGFSIMMIIVLKMDNFTEYDPIVCCVVIFIMFGLATIPFVYILGYAFKDYGSALGGVFFFCLGSGGIVGMILLIMRYISDGSNKVSRGISWGARLIPTYAFSEGLINIGSKYIYATYQNNKQLQQPFDWQIGLAPIVYLAVGAIIYPLLLLVVEYLMGGQRLQSKFARSETDTDNKGNQTRIGDEDVQKQYDLVMTSSVSDFELVTKELVKVYNIGDKKREKKSVNKLTFGVNRGSIFGLLGVNGAGKTSTFKLLTGQIKPTSGSCYIKGLEVSQNLSKIKKMIGYCPQVDALIQTITVRQELQLYYDLKSLAGEDKAKIVDDLIKEVGLQKFADQQSGTLSGGNKRKLSLAMALIGNPFLIFLDEPSSGMDPKAKRLMWKLLSQIAGRRKKCTIILTTHSMQQAEALSTRLSIMINGNFHCIGTAQHIKFKYGKGFEIQVKINYKQTGVASQNPSENNLCQKYTQVNQDMLQLQIDMFHSLLKDNLGRVEMIEHFGTLVKFRTDQIVGISKIFLLIEKCKKQSLITQYTIKQSTIEQIFNKLAEKQHNSHKNIPQPAEINAGAPQANIRDTQQTQQTQQTQ